MPNEEKDEKKEELTRKLTQIEEEISAYRKKYPHLSENPLRERAEYEQRRLQTIEKIEKSQAELNELQKQGKKLAENFNVNADIAALRTEMTRIQKQATIKTAESKHLTAESKNIEHKLAEYKTGEYPL